jgi:hypothetical protein
MKHQWYGDKRDIVKWIALLSLCHDYKVQRIFQVAMLTPDEPKKAIVINEERSCAISDMVWDHFRNLRHIRQLGLSVRIDIEVLDTNFIRSSRDDYFEAVVTKIHQQDDPIIVFLDPDTGIEPSRPSAKHIKVSEIAKLWEALKPSSCLAVYKHRPRKASAGWHIPYKAKLESVCGIRIYTFKSDIAKDVALFAARKN